MSSSDRRAVEKRFQEQRKQQQEQRQWKLDKSRQDAELRAAFNAQEEPSDDLVEALINGDDLEAGAPEALQDETVAKIQNLLSRDWVIANLTRAQEHEVRHRLEVLKIKVLGMHQPDESYVSGGLRAYLLDDRDAALEALSPEERVLIDELFETVKARVTRGREGFERELLETSIARSETAVDEEDDSGGWSWGLRS